MANSKKIVQAAAGAGGESLNLEDVFNTWVISPVGSGDVTVNQGIDISGEGGMWLGRIRNIGTDPDGRWELHDTIRGAGTYLRTDNTDGQTTSSYNFLTSFSDTGFTGWDGVSGYDVVSWTFRNSENFFQCLQYTGNGSTQSISHSLGANPGMVWIRGTNAANWFVWHRSLGDTKYLFLNGNNAEQDVGSAWIEVTDSAVNLQNNSSNTNGVTYMMYIFGSHNNSGTFGPDGDQDVIRCDSYTTSGSGTANIPLGFEPQFLLRKRVDSSQDWGLYDVMRGVYENNDYQLKPNQTAAEASAGNQYDFYPNGFTVQEHNANATYIYMAIGRNTGIAESGTDVFKPVATSDDSQLLSTGFVTDLAIGADRSGSSDNWWALDRKLGVEAVKTASTATSVNTGYTEWDSNIAFAPRIWASSANTIWYMWNRSHSFMDIVYYSGTAVAKTIDHDLRAVPDMMWIKEWNGSADNWIVYVTELGNKKMYLNLTNGVTNAGGGDFNDTAPTDSVFSVGDGTSTNRSGSSYLCYLFKSLDGVSKIGTFTSDGTNMTIDCGFTTGARFVMLKRTNSSDDWFVWDTARGISTGNDPRGRFNSTAAEATGADNIEPDNSGFIINNNILGGSGNSFLFYAIA
jgi:hypothetical protein